jgi:hypothetical protein
MHAVPIDVLDEVAHAQGALFGIQAFGTSYERH